MSESTLDFPSRDIYINNSVVFIRLLFNSIRRRVTFHSCYIYVRWMFVGCTPATVNFRNCPYKLSNGHGRTKHPTAVARTRAIYTHGFYALRTGRRMEATCEYAFSRHEKFSAKDSDAVTSAKVNKKIREDHDNSLNLGPPHAFRMLLTILFLIFGSKIPFGRRSFRISDQIVVNPEFTYLRIFCEFRLSSSSPSCSNFAFHRGGNSWPEIWRVLSRLYRSSGAHDDRGYARRLRAYMFGMPRISNIHG